MLSQRRNGDAMGLSAVEKRLDLAIPFHPLGNACPAGAASWSEHRPDERKKAGGLDEQPWRGLCQMLPVHLCQLGFEVIIDQGDRHVGRTLDHANAELFQSRFEFRCAIDSNRLNADTTFLEIFLRCLRREAEARPIGRGYARRSARCGQDITALNEPLQSCVDLVGRKTLFQLADDLAKAPSTLADRR